MSLESYAEEAKKYRKKLKAARSDFEARILGPILAAWSKETGTEIGPHEWLWDDVPDIPSKDKGRLR